jgi:hypothetical protein
MEKHYPNRKNTGLFDSFLNFKRQIKMPRATRRTVQNDGQRRWKNGIFDINGSRFEKSPSDRFIRRNFDESIFYVELFVGFHLDSFFSQSNS